MDNHAEPHDPGVVRLDSAQLRVLAHPLRSRLLAALRVYGPATATGLAQRLSTNSGATSYHLRQLAEVGLVGEDEQRGSGRERWWVSSHRGTSWSDTDFLDDPDDRAAEDWLRGHFGRLRSRWAEDWFESRHEWPREWRDAADSSDFWLRLTPERLRALNAELHEVIERHRTETDPAAPGAEQVIVLLESFPQPEPRL